MTPLVKQEDSEEDDQRAYPQARKPKRMSCQKFGKLLAWDNTTWLYDHFACIWVYYVYDMYLYPLRRIRI